MRIAIKVLALLLALGAAAHAQTGTAVKQSGNVTNGHAMYWVTNGTAADAGTANDGKITSFGVTNNGGPGICVSSAPLTAAARNQLCFAATTNGGTKISSYIYGTATNPGIIFDINGSVQGFPAVTLPVISNDLACFDGTTGQLKDCGLSPSIFSLVIGTSVVTNGTNGFLLYNNNGVLGNISAAGIGGLTIGTTTVTNSTSGRIFFNNSSILGEYAISGTGNVCMTASCAMTGTPTAPTAAVDTNTTQIATAAMVLAQAASATPLGSNPTAVVGTSTRFARGDHVHPGREILSAIRTYYIRSDGSDSTCNGQSNASAASAPACAYATWVKGTTNLVNNIDCAGNTVTFTNGNVATYTTTNTVSMSKAWVGGCSLVFDLGGGGINATGFAFSLQDFGMPGLITVQNGTLQGGGGINHSAVGTIQLGSSLTFGATTNPHIQAVTVGAQIQAVGVSYTVTGGANAHWLAADGGKLVVGLAAITFSGGGTIAFGTTGTNAFASSKSAGQILGGSNTFTCTSGCSTSGGTTTVTGRRYSAQIDGYIDTGGGNVVTQGSAPTYFPGSAVGTGSTMNLSPYGFYNG